MTSAASAQTLEPQTLTVVGHAQLVRTADLTVVQGTIQSNADSAAASVAKDAATIAAVAKAIGALGIPAAGVTVGDLAYTYRPRPSPSATPAYPNAVPMPNPFSRGFTAQFGHNVTRQIAVRTSSAELAARAADVLVANGASDVGMSSDFSGRKELEGAALAAAVQDARKQGDAEAAAAGMRIDRVKEVRPGAPLDQLLGRLENAFLGDRRNPWSANTAARTVEVYASVTVVYILK